MYESATSYILVHIGQRRYAARNFLKVRQAPADPVSALRHSAKTAVCTSLHFLRTDAASIVAHVNAKLPGQIADLHLDFLAAECRSALTIASRQVPYTS